MFRHDHVGGRHLQYGMLVGRTTGLLVERVADLRRRVRSEARLSCGGRAGARVAGRVVADAAVDHIDPRVGAVGWHYAVRERVGRVVQQLVIAGEFDADLAVAGVAVPQCVITFQHWRRSPRRQIRHVERHAAGHPVVGRSAEVPHAGHVPDNAIDLRVFGQLVDDRDAAVGASRGDLLLDVVEDLRQIVSAVGGLVVAEVAARTPIGFVVRGGVRIVAGHGVHELVGLVVLPVAERLLLRIGAFEDADAVDERAGRFHGERGLHGVIGDSCAKSALRGRHTVREEDDDFLRAWPCPQQCRPRGGHAFVRRGRAIGGQPAHR